MTTDLKVRAADLFGDLATKADIDHLSGRVDQLSGRVDHLSGRVDDLSGRVDHLSGRVDRVSGQIADLHRLTVSLIETVNANTQAMQTALKDQAGVAVTLKSAPRS